MSNENIIFLFIKEFKYKDPIAEQAMNMHPYEGRVYRAVKEDSGGYLLHVGSHRTLHGEDGLRLSRLKSNNKNWKCNIVEIDSDNITDLDITPEDMKLLVEWDKEQNASLVQLINNAPSVEDENGIPYDLGNINIDIPKEILENIQTREYSSGSFGALIEKDMEMGIVMSDLTDYLNSTYGDKYHGAAISTGPFIESEYGKGFNCGNSLKYLSRYCTEGYHKSNNVQDLFKAIHYILFELKRRYKNG